MRDSTPLEFSKGTHEDKTTAIHSQIGKGRFMATPLL